MTTPKTMKQARRELRRMRKLNPLTALAGLRCWVRFAAASGQAFTGKAARIAGRR